MSVITEAEARAARPRDSRMGNQGTPGVIKRILLVILAVAIFAVLLLLVSQFVGL